MSQKLAQEIKNEHPAVWASLIHSGHGQWLLEAEEEDTEVILAEVKGKTGDQLYRDLVNIVEARRPDEEDEDELPEAPKGWQAGEQEWRDLIEAVDGDEKEGMKLAEAIIAKASGAQGQQRVVQLVLTSLQQKFLVEDIVAKLPRSATEQSVPHSHQKAPTARPAPPPNQPPRSSAREPVRLTAATHREKRELQDWWPEWMPMVYSPLATIIGAAAIVLIGILLVLWVASKFLGPAPIAEVELTATAESELLGQGGGAPVAGEQTATPVPTVTPLPPTPESPLASGCPGGYQTYLRFPAPEAMGQQGWRTLDFTQDPVGPKFEDRLYRVTEVKGRPDKLTVQTGRGAYFVPTSFYPPVLGEASECAPLSDVPAFNAAFALLNPEGGSFTTLFDGDWWAKAGWGFAILLLLAAVTEAAVKRQLDALAILGSITAIAWASQKSMSNEGQWLIYIGGFMGTLALGYRGALHEINAAMRRTGQVQLPPEVRELMDQGEGIRRVVTAADWSRPAWWAGINLVWGVLTSSGSPLHQQIGPLAATILLGFQCLLFYALESWRRNRTGDWGVLAAALIGALVTSGLALWLPHGSATQTIAMMATALVGVVAIVLVGISGQQAIERDRIPDGLAAFASLALTGLILVVRLFP